MNKRFLFLLLLTAGLSSVVSAQRGYVRDAVRNKEYKEHGVAGEDKLNGWLGKVSDVRVARSYRFPMFMQMHLITYGRKGKIKDEQDMNMYVNAGRSTFGMMMFVEKRGERKESTFSIYDYKNNTSMIFNMKDRTYMAFNLNAFMSRENQMRRETGNARTNSDIDCKKTGRTRVIQGYKCSEFVCENVSRNEKTEFWVSTQLPVTMSEALAATMRQRYYGNTTGMNGAVLEQYSYRDGELVSEMKVTAFEPAKNFVFNTEEYRYNGIGEVHFSD